MLKNLVNCYSKHLGMDEWRYLDKHIYYEGGAYTYQVVTSIGEGVVITRTGIIDLVEGQLHFQEMNMVVDGFDGVYYNRFRNLLGINEVILCSMLKKHIY